MLALGHLSEDAVEQVGPQRPGLGHLDADRGEHFGERAHLLQGRLVVDAVDQRRTRLLQGLGRRDVGLDHELLDQPVRLQPLRHDHPVHAPFRVEEHLALGQVEGEGTAGVAGPLHRLVGRVERAERRLQNRARLLVRPAVDRGLGLRVGELGVRAHQDAVEAVAPLHPVGADDHAHGERRTVLALAERTEIVRDPFGQHRYHPVGEVDRVAPQKRLPVEGRVRPDIGRHVRDRDGDHEAAFIGRIGIGLRHHRVVVILGIGRVDGDERRLAPVLAAAPRRALGRIGFRENRGGEDVRDVVEVQRDQAHRLLGAERAEPFRHPPAGQAEAGLALDRDADEIAVARLALLAGGDRDLAPLRLLLDGEQAPAVAPGAIDADHFRTVLADHLDDPAGIAARRLRIGCDADQRPIAEAGRRAVALAAGAGHLDGDFRRLAPALPLRRARDQVAIAVARDDVGENDGRQAAALAEPAAVAVERAVGLDLLQDRLETDLVGARDPEGFGDLAFADLSGRLGDEGEDLLAGGKSGGTRLRIDASGQGVGLAAPARTGSTR